MGKKACAKEDLIQKSSHKPRTMSNAYQRTSRRRERIAENVIWLNKSRPEGALPLLETRSLNLQVSLRLLAWLDLFAEFLSETFPECSQGIHHGSIVESLVPQAFRKDKAFLEWVAAAFPDVSLETLEFASRGEEPA